MVWCRKKSNEPNPGINKDLVCYKDDISYLRKDRIMKDVAFGQLAYYLE